MELLLFLGSWELPPWLELPNERGKSGTGEHFTLAAVTGIRCVKARGPPAAACL